MTAIRIGVKKGNQVKIARSQEALDHFVDLGFEVLPDGDQPTQPADYRPVVMQKGKRIKRTTAGDVERWLDLGYKPVGGKAQDEADAKFEKHLAKLDKAHKEKQGKAKQKPKALKKKTAKAKSKTGPTSKGKAKAKTEPKAKAKKEKAPDPNVVLADLLGELPERDDATKAIVNLLRTGYPVDLFKSILVEWDVDNLTAVKEADRAEFLLEMQNKSKTSG